MIRVATLLLWSLVGVTGHDEHRTRTTVQDFKDTCLDAKYHKQTPSPDPELFEECAPWRENACCNSTITRDLHTQDKWLSLSWNHCPGNTMSPNCRRHFLRDLCFYECSPNVGPWIVDDHRKNRNERFRNVPLCQNQCNTWWQDCQNEVTCVADWVNDFVWTSGQNTCPIGSDCRTFTEVYRNANNFCEKIFDSSWKVVPDSEPCMRIQFSGPNPNNALASAEAEKRASDASCLSVSHFGITLSIIVLILILSLIA